MNVTLISLDDDGGDGNGLSGGVRGGAATSPIQLFGSKSSGAYCAPLPLYGVPLPLCTSHSEAFHVGEGPRTERRVALPFVHSWAVPRPDSPRTPKKSTIESCASRIATWSSPFECAAEFALSCLSHVMPSEVKTSSNTTFFLHKIWNPRGWSVPPSSAI